jgi:DNA repair protein RecO (recombination protein O)
MYKVSQSDIIKSFYNISYDIEAFSYASYITKLVEDSVFENQTNNRLFILLAQTLHLYSTLDIDYKYITRAFELKFLEYIGYKPIVSKCANCKNTKLENGMFNIHEGGVLCKDCQNKFENNLKIDQTTIKLMDYILNNDILTCNKAKVSKYITNELEKILRMYMQNYLDNLNLKSLYLLQNMDNI